MNQYKMCMGMWNSFFSNNTRYISKVQQRDKKNQSETMTSETIQDFWESKGGGAFKVTEVQPTT